MWASTNSRTTSMVSSSTEEIRVILWFGIYGIRDALLGTLTHQVAADGLGVDPGRITLPCGEEVLRAFSLLALKGKTVQYCTPSSRQPQAALRGKGSF